eukprot:10867471-Alexandrium_andersonii.AAC.1
MRAREEYGRAACDFQARGDLWRLKGVRIVSIPCGARPAVEVDALVGEGTVVIGGTGKRVASGSCKSAALHCTRGG